MNNNRYYLTLMKDILTNKYINKQKKNLINELLYRQAKFVFEYYTLQNGDAYFICPTCKLSLEREYMTYCVYCGQHLSWKGTMKNKRKII